MKKKILLPYIAVLTAAAGIGARSTAALFTDKDEARIDVTSGKVDISATIQEIMVCSAVDIEYYNDHGAGHYDYLGDTYNGLVTDTDENEHLYVFKFMEDNTFYCGGTVTYEDSILTLDRMVPGDRVYVPMAIENLSNVDVKIRLVIECLSTDNDDLDFYSSLITGLYSESAVTPDVDTTHAIKYASEWRDVSAGDADEDFFIYGVYLPLTETIQDRECKIKISYEAVQANAHVENEGGTIRFYTKTAEVVAGDDGLSDLELVCDDVPVKATIKTSSGRVNVGDDPIEVGDKIRFAVTASDQPGPISMASGETGSVSYDVSLTEETTGAPVTSSEKDIELEIHVGAHTVTRAFDEDVMTIPYQQSLRKVIIPVDSSTAFTLFYNDEAPRNSLYFYDSYMVTSSGERTEDVADAAQWIHEISTVDHFRNIMLAADWYRNLDGMDGADGLWPVFKIKDDLSFNKQFVWRANEYSIYKNFVLRDCTIDGGDCSLCEFDSTPFVQGIDDENLTNVGVFPVISGSVYIHNLHFSNCKINGGGADNVGLLAGTMDGENNPKNWFNIEECNIDTANKGYCTITNANNNVGGFVGTVKNYPYDEVNSNSIGFDNVIIRPKLIQTTGDNVGGLVGLIDNCGHVEISSMNPSTLNGEMVGINNVGGCVGQVKDTDSFHCQLCNPVSAVVSGTSNVSCLVGFVNNVAHSLFENNLVNGIANGTSNVGGIIGKLDGNESCECIVDDCQCSCIVKVISGCTGWFVGCQAIPCTYGYNLIGPFAEVKCNGSLEDIIFDEYALALASENGDLDHVIFGYEDYMSFRNYTNYSL